MKRPKIEKFLEDVLRQQERHDDDQTLSAEKRFMENGYWDSHTKIILEMCKYVLHFEAKGIDSGSTGGTQEKVWIDGDYDDDTMLDNAGALR